MSSLSTVLLLYLVCSYYCVLSDLLWLVAMQPTGCCGEWIGRPDECRTADRTPSYRTNDQYPALCCPTQTADPSNFIVWCQPWLPGVDALPVPTGWSSFITPTDGCTDRRVNSTYRLTLRIRLCLLPAKHDKFSRTTTEKTPTYVFDCNSGVSWSILIPFVPMETRMNTLQFIYLILWWRHNCVTNVTSQKCTSQKFTYS